MRTFDVGGAGALSPADDTAAFGRDDGTVEFVDLRTGSVRPAERRATGRVLGLAFSRDGKVLATSSDDGSVGIWDVPTGRLRERLHRPRGRRASRRSSARTGRRSSRARATAA